ncbi:hypothetical protein GCM10010301_09460 [Streptomyces plicatus]|nr:hypothetical protein GCM10010301_09460 [Streptomyces plicatus]
MFPSAVARPWQTDGSPADLVCAFGAVCAAFEAFAITNAPPPATVAALTRSASFFFVPSVLLRDMRAS